jgi:hypothetical protein
MLAMTIDEFFSLYPVSKRGIAKMLGTSPRFLYNVSQRHNTLPDEQVKYLNMAIQELSYQLSQTFIANNLTYEAKCLRCRKKFTAKYSGQRADFYDQNGLMCDGCMEKVKA